MRRLSLLLGTIVALTLVAPLPRAQACEYEFEPEDPEGAAGTEITLTFTIIWTHRRCDLQEQDVKLTLDNVTLVRQTPWEKVKRMTYQSEITVKLGKPGEGSVRVWRTCQRENTHGKTAVITITG